MKNMSKGKFLALHCITVTGLEPGTQTELLRKTYDQAGKSGQI